MSSTMTSMIRIFNLSFLSSKMNVLIELARRRVMQYAMKRYVEIPRWENGYLRVKTRSMTRNRFSFSITYWVNITIAMDTNPIVLVA